MKKLTKAQQEELAKHLEALRAADEFISGLADAMNDYEGERSEKWSNSDAGAAYVEWREGYEAVQSTLQDLIGDVEGLEPEPNK
ncbi:hypothetical protein GJ654_10305 [Rhodoblastus acidophilus]|uniref:Uncharacterized protein n=1 Tax=Rhodoblastus acidophilus TaxID=1074 RepID=A0A6N8DPC2_RHOAC|nr:hypothetical protein [Rhodoblastus acidophilus]MCW2275116.1 hypothetical protein [Rhodoblastus acidophilus]MTV31385.1 hypothetical protein [Rhodoblastus acidophilus]